MEQAPLDVDPAVWRVVRAAHALQTPVTLYVRGGGGSNNTNNTDESRANAMRVVTGVPARFDLATSGEVRVVLALAPDVEQRVVVARAVRARLATVT